MEKDSLAQYRSAWQATTKLLREGHSFSGHEKNCAFLNSRDNRFANASSITGLDFDDDARSIGVTDWDQDGDLDIWFHNRTGPRLRLMQNQTNTVASKNGQHFVAFRLQGTSSNRDAIGARVTVFVEGDDRPLVQTLYAGDAYLSQSTKWIHFGLGKTQKIEKVSIRWPSGLVEEISNLRINCRYQIVEGEGRSQVVPPRGSQLAIKASTQPKHDPAKLTRTFFSNRVPLPILKYRPLDGSTERRVVETEGQPLMIVLWASWCPNCVRELNFLAKHADQIRSAGLHVLALSLDGLDEEQTTDAADAKRLIEEIDFPFDTGIVMRDVLEKLQRLQELQFNRLQPTAVPASLLISRHGELAATYRGSVGWKTLEQDIANLDATGAMRRQRAVPFAGRWSTPPKQLLLRAVAGHFKKNGFEEDYARYLKLEAASIQRQRSLAGSAAERKAIDQRFASANFNLGISLVASGQAAEAIAYFQRAVEAQPNHVDALTNLGVLWAQRRKVDEAIDLFRRALQIDPNAGKARMNLAAALGASKRYAEAIEHYRILAKKDPTHFTAHSRLARFLLETGQASEAVPYLETAIRLNDADFPSSISLAWLRATHPDPTIRDATAALEIANRIQQFGGANRAIALDVLAAAFAENGEFEEAIKISQTAIETLPAKSPLRRMMISRRERYKDQQPFRDVDGKYP